MSLSTTGNINDTFFDGLYKHIWRSIFPETITKAEVDFLIKEARLQSGSEVLDLMCGYGRHAIAFAKKGIKVTAVDNLEDYINEISVTAQEENLCVLPILADVIQFRPKGNYDVAICMGNNLSFFNREEILKLFAMIYSCLKKDDKFIFNTWMIAEIVNKQFKEKSSAYVGEIEFSADSKYFYSPSRIETESVFVTPDGKKEVKKAVDYIYSLNETEHMLRESGFFMKEVWSIPGKKEFTLGEPRAYIVAQRL
jgi:SAM-dependent methyltransferase